MTGSNEFASLLRWLWQRLGKCTRRPYVVMLCLTSVSAFMAVTSLGTGLFLLVVITMTDRLFT